MPKVAEAVLLDIYDAWRAHNLDLLGMYLPTDFAHSINIPVETHPLGGLREGKDAVLQRLDMLFQEFETRSLEVQPVTITASDAAIDVQTRCVHRLTGASLDLTKRNLWTLEHSWPVSLSEIYDLESVRELTAA